MKIAIGCDHIVTDTNGSFTTLKITGTRSDRCWNL